jgi:alkylation response protein AidB-like acyl-CoA dehydrogenase
MEEAAMIDFSLSQEQQQLRDLAHEFAANEIQPKAAEHDDVGSRGDAVR